MPRLAVATNTVEKRRASLLTALARSTEQIAKEPDSYKDLQNCALLNAALGNKEEAIRVAKRAVELAFETLFTLVKVPKGLYYGVLKLDPAWDNIRDDPRFGDLLVQTAKPF